MQMNVSIVITATLVARALDNSFAKRKFTCSLSSHGMHLYLDIT